MENSICSFILKFPRVVGGLENDVNFQDANLNEFKNWIIDIVNENDAIDQELIASKVKNTRFSDSFSVLSSSDILFLDYAFLNDENVDQEQVFEWLCKQHYLLLLKNEYADILKSNAYDEQSKTMSYLEEIRRVTKEINHLSDNFINNQ